MVTTRSRASNTDQAGVALRAVATQRQQRRRDTARQRRNDNDAAAAAATTVGGAAINGVYRDMLMEAGVPSPAGRQQQARANADDADDDAAPPPAKRLKLPGQKSQGTAQAREESDDDDDDDVEFEDIAIPEPVIQTTELDSDEDDDEDEDEGGDENEGEDGTGSVQVSFSGTPPTTTTTTTTTSGNGPLPAALASDEPPKTLELNLSIHDQAVEILRSRIGNKGRRGGGRAGGQAAAHNRRKPLTKAERLHRVQIHKLHVLCLLAHVARRNSWCNSPKVQAALRPLLTDKMVAYLNPGRHLSQFGQTESLKNGLQQAAVQFKTRFRVTERGLRRALWAESPGQLRDYQLPADLETVLDKDDFVHAAKTLQGSRDVGAQLFCALLRAAGVEARLVCSLQPLSFLSNAPTMPKAKANVKAKQKHPIPSIYQSSSSSMPAVGTATADPFASPLSRLGHPDAAAYNMPSVVASPAPPSRRQTASESAASSTHVVRGESPFPVYWVEVLDVAHQKWQPVDPLVTCTQWRPAKLEPPATDKNNQLSYVIGFNEDGEAKDVTRRYAKAYNAKTKRSRVDGVVDPAASLAAALAAAAGALLTSPGNTESKSKPSTSNVSGTKWLRRALRYFRQSYPTDLDQIEDRELGVLESREPMPRNIADFQNHPVYALVRHLRRHEVLIPNATSVGSVSAGNKAPLERIYRRRDVRLAYSTDRWYRLGRVVRPGEIPVKWLPKPVSRKRGLLGDDDDDDDKDRNRTSFAPVAVGSISNNNNAATAADDDDDLFGDNELDSAANQSHPPPNGVPLFMPEQTDLYQAPPVEDGRIPKNKFGNIDIYVPSMVPAGGEYIHDDSAGRAAFILGVDYAPALTGFKFEGRKGTAVLRGAVVAKEHADAVRAVIEGLVDLQAEVAAQRRTRAALRMWSVFLRGLRIRARIRAAAEDRGEDVDNDEEGGTSAVVENSREPTPSKDSGDDDKDDKQDDDDAAIDDAKSDVTEEFDMVMDDDDDEGGGGFMLDDDDEGGGGFLPE